MFWQLARSKPPEEYIGFPEIKVASELLGVSIQDWEVLAIVEMREAFAKARREEQNPPLEPLTMDAWDNMYKSG